MASLASFVVRHRWWVIAAWLLLAVAGGVAAPMATANLSYDFGLPGQPGYETNQQIVRQSGSGGGNAPALLVVGDGKRRIERAGAAPIVRAVDRAVPRARIASYADQPRLLSASGRVGVLMIYPRPLPNAPEPYAQALPALRRVAAAQALRLDVPVRVTGQDALADDGGGGGANVLAETLFGGIGALIVLALVFGSFLALTRSRLRRRRSSRRS